MATEREVYNALVGAGFSMAQAAGIMGNLQNESSFNQEAVNPGGPTAGVGLAQWETTYYPIAATFVTGNLPDDLADQIAEIQVNAKSVYMGGSAVDVAGAWASQFERCAGCEPGGPQWSSRRANAQRIYQQAQTGHWPTGPGNPGGPPSPGGVQTLAMTSAPGLSQFLSPWWLPFNLFEPTGNIVSGLATSIEDVAQAAAGISNVLTEALKLIAWWFVPSHIVRVFCFLIGAPLVGFGIWNLTRTGAPYSVDAGPLGSVPMAGGNLAPALGIAEVTVGAVFLFIAFHNLPSTVTDLPSLLTYVQGNVAPQQAPAPGATQ